MSSKQTLRSFKRKIYIPAILLLFILLLQSCRTYQRFSINVLEPADIAVPQRIGHLLIVPGFFPERSDKRHIAYEIYGSKFHDTVYYDTAFARASAEYLAGMLNYNLRFTAATLDSIPFYLPPLATDITDSHISRIRALCVENEADALVLLSEMGKGIEYETYTSYLGSSIGFFTVILNTRWLFIDPFEVKLIDQRVIRDTLYYQTEGFYGVSDPNFFFTGRELLKAAAEESAMNYGWRITPHFVETSRIIFQRGNRHIRRGYKQAIEGNWTSAAMQWRNSLTDSDPLNRARASFNLALAGEMEGLLEPALMWAERSYQSFPDSINQTYISILHERLRQQQDLLLQLEGSND